MEKEIIEFPEITGIKWISKDCPDIIQVGILLYNKDEMEMELDNMEEITSVQYIDLSQLVGVRFFFPKKENEASKIECFIDVNGMALTVVQVSLPKMMKAWLFYKTWKYATRNI